VFVRSWKLLTVRAASRRSTDSTLPVAACPTAVCAVSGRATVSLPYHLAQMHIVAVSSSTSLPPHIKRTIDATSHLYRVLSLRDAIEAVLSAACCCGRIFSGSRVRMTPHEDGTCELSGRADYGKLFSGIVVAHVLPER
jgi:hypothetical protein